jgi:hypothetical protein
MGPQADWSVVDALMLKTLAAAEKVARYKHAQLSAVRLAGDVNAKMDSMSLDELLVTIKQEWAKLGPLIDLEAVQEPQGSRRAREAAQIAGGQLHPRRGMTAGPEEEIALLMRRWEQVKAGDGAVVLIGGEPGNREIAPRAAAHRVAEARRIVANQSSRSNGGLTTFDCL